MIEIIQKEKVNEIDLLLLFLKFTSVNSLSHKKKKSKVVFYIYTTKREELEMIDSCFL